MKAQRKSLPEEINTFSFVVRAIQAHAGTETENILRMIGAEMGHAISKRIDAPDVIQLLAEIGKLSKGLDIGEMTVTMRDPIQLSFHGCLGCDQIPGPGQQVYCPIREAFLKAVIDDKLKVNSTVKFVESVGSEWGMKDCTFRVDMG